MKLFDKAFILTLLVFDAIAILIGMVSGPFGYNSLSIGASVSAIIISALIVVYGLICWRRTRR